MKGLSPTRVAALSWARRGSGAWLLGLIAIAGLASVIASGGGGGSDTPDRIVAPPPPGTVSLQAIEVTPASPSLASGTSLDLVATGVLSDGTTRNYTDKVTWGTSDPAVAPAPVDGRVTTLSKGIVTLTASLFGKSGSTSLTVTDATLSRLEIIPHDPQLARRTQLNLAAVGHYSDGSSQDLTTRVAWATADASIAQVDASGMLSASAVNAGNVTINASLDGSSVDATVTVSTAQLTALAIEPASPSLLLGTGMTLTATGFFSDGTTQDLSTQVAWGSSKAGVAIVGNTLATAGMVVTQGPGSTTVGAGFGSVSTSTLLTVRLAVPESIEVSPASATLASGHAQTLLALGHFDDGTTQDISAYVIWKSSVPAVLAVSNASGSEGLATALGVGNANISAMLVVDASTTLEGSASLTVTNALLESIDIEPAAPRIAKGTRLALRAIGRYSDDSIQDLTGQVSWATASTASTAVADIDSGGVVQAAEAGATKVTALLDGVSGTAALTVTDAQLKVLDIEPRDTVLVTGIQTKLKAMGGFSDGSLQDLTGQVTWESSRDAVATVSSAGVLEALGAGESRVTASFEQVSGAGWRAGSAAVTVVDADLTAIEIAPNPLTLAAGTEVSLTATGTYNDGSSDYPQDVTDQVAWRSADESVARVDNGEGRVGRLYAVAAGSAVISASLGGLSGDLDLTVTDATLSSLSIVAPATPLYSGTSQQLTANGLFDGSSQDLTDQVVWSSSNPSLVQVSNALETRGRVTAAVGADGPVTISAAYAGVGPTLDLSVSNQPQRPVSLVVWAEPDVINRDNSDAATLTVQVLAADPGAAVADTTVINVAISDGQTVLQTSSVTTTGGTASLNFTTATPGQLGVQATESTTGVSHATSLLSTPALKDVITGIAFTDVVVSNGQMQADGRFGAFAFNTSNRAFRLTRLVFCNGPFDPLSSTCNGEVLEDIIYPNNSFLPGGDRTGAIYPLPTDVTATSESVSAIFFLEEPATNQPFFFRIVYSLPL